MYIISKEFHFSASHILNKLPDGHPCGRLHGHNYIVVIELSDNKLDDTGFVLDYGELKPIKEFIDNELDHRHLNDLIPQPSAECIAKFIFDKFKFEYLQMTAVKVSETPKTWAEYRRPQ